MLRLDVLLAINCIKDYVLCHLCHKINMFIMHSVMFAHYYSLAHYFFYR